MASSVEPRSFQVLLVSTDKRVELLILAPKKRAELVTPEILPQLRTARVRRLTDASRRGSSAYSRIDELLLMHRNGAGALVLDQARQSSARCRTKRSTAAFRSHWLPGQVPKNDCPVSCPDYLPT